MHFFFLIAPVTSSRLVLNPPRFFPLRATTGRNATELSPCCFLLVVLARCFVDPCTALRRAQQRKTQRKNLKAQKRAKGTYSIHVIKKCFTLNGNDLKSTARLAQSVERKALNLVVVGSSPTVGDLTLNFFASACMDFSIRSQAKQAFAHTADKEQQTLKRKFHLPLPILPSAFCTFPVRRSGPCASVLLLLARALVVACAFLTSAFCYVFVDGFYRLYIFSSLSHPLLPHACS